MRYPPPAQQGRQSKRSGCSSCFPSYGGGGGVGRGRRRESGGGGGDDVEEQVEKAEVKEEEGVEEG